MALVTESAAIKRSLLKLRKLLDDELAAEKEADAFEREAREDEEGG